MADNLTGQNIQDTYQRLVQVNDGQLLNGTGSNLPISFDGNNVTISGSLTANEYIVSSSVTNITIATLSGSTEFGNSEDDTHTFIGHITASGGISASGTIIANKIESDSLISHAGDANTGLQFASDTVIIEGNNTSLAQFNTSGINFYKNLTSTGTITCTTLNTGHGQFEVGQNTLTTSDVIFNQVTAGTVSSSGVIIGNRLHTDDYIVGDTSVATGLSVNGYIETTNGNITAAGNISASGTLTLGDGTNLLGGKRFITSTSNYEFRDGSVTAMDGILTGQITASGNISTSGNIIGVTGSFDYVKTDKLQVGTAGGTDVLSIDGGDLQLENGKQITFSDIGDGNTGRVRIVGNEDNDTILMHVDNSTSHVLALTTTGVGVGTTSPGEKLEVVGNISASGTIVGSNLSGTNTGDQDLSGYVLNAITSSLLVRNSETGSFLTSIPTGTVSSSLQLPEGTLSSSLQLPTGIFSASAGGDLLLPHNGEVGYDSDNHILFGSTQVAIDATIFNINASNRVNFHDTNVGIRPSNPNTVPPEALTVEGNISASGDVYASNIQTPAGSRVVGAPYVLKHMSKYLNPTAGRVYYGNSTFGHEHHSFTTYVANNTDLETLTDDHMNNTIIVPFDTRNIELRGQIRVSGQTDNVPVFWLYTGSREDGGLGSATALELGWAASASRACTSGGIAFNIDITGSAAFRCNAGDQILFAIQQNGTAAVYKFNWVLSGERE